MFPLLKTYKIWNELDDGNFLKRHNIQNISFEIILWNDWFCKTHIIWHTVTIVILVFPFEVLTTILISFHWILNLVLAIDRIPHHIKWKIIFFFHFISKYIKFDDSKRINLSWNVHHVFNHIQLFHTKKKENYDPELSANRHNNNKN